MANKHLHLNLKGEYFHAIRAGKKVEEYRLYNDYWRKRLEGREYTRLIIKWDYPSDDEKDRIIVLPYMGYEIKLIQHPLFGPDPVKVFAIKCDIYWQYRL
ncbi:RNA-binding protein [Escherichia coli]|uniref:RNA-binding protein n=1 Tax=Escherichia coli TaxID=562 RepID=UPI00211DAC5E|nr:RNA-binding protein [Escherichia coli]